MPSDLLERHSRSLTSDGPLDRRRAPRFALEMGVEVEFPTAGSRRARVRDIGPGGMCLAALEPPIWRESVVVITLGGYAVPAPIKICGIVRWVEEGGFGVQFDALDAQQSGVVLAFTRASEIAQSNRIEWMMQCLDCWPWSIG